MINQLDNLQCGLFPEQITNLTDKAQVRFQPLDENWLTYVTNLQHNALNIYLADLRENRKLCSGTRTRSTENDIIGERPAPPGYCVGPYAKKSLAYQNM
jgi:hypothetical protein